MRSFKKLINKYNQIPVRLGVSLLGSLLLVLAMLLTNGLPLAAQELQGLPALSGRVVDQTDTLTAEQKAALSAKLQVYEQTHTHQVVVALVESTKPESIEQYSLRLVEKWQLGQQGKDNGVLLLIAKSDRKLRIEVGYGLEDRLPDARCKQIIDDTIVPAFKKGEFYQGINIGVDRILLNARGAIDPAAELAAERERQRQAEEKKYQYWSIISDASYWWLGICGVLAFAFLLRSKKFWMGMVVPAALFGLPMLGLALWYDPYFYDALIVLPIFWFAYGFLWLIFRTEHSGSGGSYSGSSYSGSSYSSSSYSSSSSSSYSSSSSSSYSGGGGSFGGGGASGSW